MFVNNVGVFPYPIYDLTSSVHRALIQPIYRLDVLKIPHCTAIALSHYHRRTLSESKLMNSSALRPRAFHSL